MWLVEMYLNEMNDLGLNMNGNGNSSESKNSAAADLILEFKSFLKKKSHARLWPKPRMR